MALLRLITFLWAFQGVLLVHLALAQLSQDYSVRPVIDPLTNSWVDGYF